MEARSNQPLNNGVKVDTDFVNKFIQKQSQLIAELTSKNLMVEVKLQQLEERYNELVAQHQALVDGVERARLAAEEQAVRLAEEQEAQKHKTQKKQTAIKQPLETGFVVEQQTESQF